MKLFEVRKCRAVEKCERAVTATTKFKHASDLAHSCESEQNRDVRGVVVFRARGGEIFRAKAQRRKVFYTSNHLCVFASLREDRKSTRLNSSHANISYA